MALNLDKEQITFIKKHKISKDSILDATGLKNKEYRQIMIKNNKKIAIGVVPCKKFGHTMRGSGGHCVQCNPNVLSFDNRSNLSGFVYIAGSIKLNSFKIGSTTSHGNIKNSNKSREFRLNQFEKYAGTDDWKIILCIGTKNNPVKIETDIHRYLKKFLNPIRYRKKLYRYKGEVKKNKWIIAREMFSCSYHTVKNAVEKVIKNYESVNEEWEDANLISEYNFNDVKTSQTSTNKYKDYKDYEDIKKKHPNASSAWTASEENNLIKLYNKDLSMSEISEIHKRSPGGIMARLIKLGFIGDESGIILRNRKIIKREEIKTNFRKSDFLKIQK